MRTPTPVTLTPADTDWPASLVERMGSAAPNALHAIGPVTMLAERKTALFCSVRTPGEVILPALDTAQRWRDEGVRVISGFHSPIEKECLDLLLRGKQPVIVCPARSLHGFNIPSDWRPALDNGRLLVLSAFPSSPRVTVDIATQRNLLVAALADEIFIVHGQPGSKTEALASKVASWGKPFSTLENRDNNVLVALGADPVCVEDQ